MHDRSSTSYPFREIKLRWNLQGDFSFEPHYNIAPSQSVPVLVKTKAGYETKLMKWGLVPSWSKDSGVGNRLINARAETLLQKPSFRDLVSRQRCESLPMAFTSGGAMMRRRVVNGLPKVQRRSCGLCRQSLWTCMTCQTW